MKSLYRASRSLSRLTKGIVTFLATLVGIRRERRGKLDYSRLIIAGWVFIVLLCAGTILIGPAFPISTLLIIILISIISMNLENAAAELVKLTCTRRQQNG